METLSSDPAIINDRWDRTFSIPAIESDRERSSAIASDHMETKLSDRTIEISNAFLLPSQRVASIRKKKNRKNYSLSNR